MSLAKIGYSWNEVMRTWKERGHEDGYLADVLIRSETPLLHLNAMLK